MAAAALLGSIAVAAPMGGPAAANAGEATLSWQPPTANMDGSPITDLAGYKVYIGTSPGYYPQSVDAGKEPVYLAYNLSAGNTYYFAVTAYNSSGEESPFSEEVSKAFPATIDATAAAMNFTLQDALLALRHAVGISPLTAIQLSQYDVAPRGADGRPDPDGAVDIADATAILKISVGLTTW